MRRFASGHGGGPAPPHSQPAGAGEAGEDTPVAGGELGYESWADKVLLSSAAGSPSDVWTFLEGLRRAYGTLLRPCWGSWRAAGVGCILWPQHGPVGHLLLLAGAHSAPGPEEEPQASARRRAAEATRGGERMRPPGVPVPRSGRPWGRGTSRSNCRPAAPGVVLKDPEAWAGVRRGP